MKKRFTKLAALLMAGTMSVSLLAGCGSSSSTSDAKTDDAAATEETTDDAATDDAAATDTASESNGGTEVTLWHYFEHEAKDLEVLVDKYNEMQDKIHITATYVARDELMNQYTIGAVSGELPDIGMVDSPDMASYISLGVFEDITDDVKGWEGYDKLLPGPLASCTDADGKIYGIPNNTNCLALCINKTMFDAAGLKAPETWEDFEAACEKLTDSANGVYGFAMSANANEEGTFQYIPWLYAAGGTVADLGSAEAIKTSQFLGDLVSNGYMSKEVVNWTQSDAQNAFAAQKAAMFEMGLWHLADIDEKIGGAFEYEVCMLPKDKTYASVIGGENMAVCTGAQEKEECVKFIEWLESAENCADFCEAAGKLPIRTDAVELKSVWTEDVRYQVFNDEMEYAVARGPHSQWPSISEAIYSAEQKVLLGESSAEDAMAEASGKVTPILEEDPLP